MQYSNPEAIYLKSLAEDLAKVSKQLSVWAEDQELYGELELDYLEAARVAVVLDKISMLFKQRMGLNIGKAETGNS